MPVVTNGRPLRLLRSLIEGTAAVVITLTLASVAFPGGGIAAWLMKLQLVPAAMTMATSIILFWLSATLAFGRIYCSSVCPMGALQDAVARCVRLTPHAAARRRYRYAPPPPSRRMWIFPIALALLLLVGATSVAVLIEPFAAYERIVVTIRQICTLRFASILFSGFFVAAFILITVIITASASGRTLCNTVCPVGTVLGAVARFSVFRIGINTDLCTHCNRCVDVCKAGCINPDTSAVDASRCVVCFDCLTVCPNKAISYSDSRHTLSIPMMQSLAKPDTSAPSQIQSVNPPNSSNETIS